MALSDFRTTNAAISRIYSSISGVGIGQTETVLSYNVPATGITYCQKILVSGSNIAQYDIKLNGAVIERLRTNFIELNAETTYGVEANTFGLKLKQKDLLEILVYNFRPSLGDFNASVELATI